VVGKNSPELATELHDKTNGKSVAGGAGTLSAAIDDEVSDSAALTIAANGLLNEAKIKYAFYTNSTCTENAVNQTPSPNTFTSPEIGRASCRERLENAGTYYWQAEYSGDANNREATNEDNKSLVDGKNKPETTTGE